MPTLFEKIQSDLKQSMLAKDENRTGTLRMLISKIRYDAIAAAAGERTLPDDQILKVIQGQIKQRKESIEQFRAANRAELAAKEESEMKILQEYLPSQLTGDALREAIRQAVAATGAAGPKDMGKVMKQMTQQYAGQYDGKECSQLVGELLKG